MHKFLAWNAALFIGVMAGCGPSNNSAIDREPISNDETIFSSDDLKSEAFNTKNNEAYDSTKIAAQNQEPPQWLESAAAKQRSESAIANISDLARIIDTGGPLLTYKKTETPEEEILRRYGVTGSHEIDKTKLHGPDDHRRLANIYFIENNPEEAYHHLEQAALYDFHVGRKLGKYHESQKNYRKAYFYYVLSGPESPWRYNAERLRALHPPVDRLFPYLTATDHYWVETEIKRQLETRATWAKQEMIKQEKEFLKRKEARKNR